MRLFIRRAPVELKSQRTGRRLMAGKSHRRSVTPPSPPARRWKYHAHTGSEKKQASKPIGALRCRRLLGRNWTKWHPTTRALGKTRRATKPRRHGRRVIPTFSKLSRKGIRKACPAGGYWLASGLSPTGQKILIIFGAAIGSASASVPSSPWRSRLWHWRSRPISERAQWYFQRYIKHLPSGGKIVLMDRSATVRR